MRRVIVLLSISLGAVSPAFAQVSIGIGLPNLSIGINLPLYPQFEQVQGYPVYYAPHAAGACKLLLLRRDVLGVPGR